jgi:hypothetical protein
MSAADAMAIDSALESLYGDILKDRECGGCIECCIRLKVEHPELRKQAGTPCPHLVGAGCGIYDKRPSVCRSWHCLWRVRSELPNAARPDRCGVIFSIHWIKDGGPFEDPFIRAICKSPDDFLHPAVVEALARFVHMEVMPVWLYSPAKKILLFPDETLAKAMLCPEKTTDPALLARASALRRKWQMA